MNIFEKLKEYGKQKAIDRLLPYGIDRTMAIVILHAMNRNIEFNLEEEGIYETGYYAILDRLSFKIEDLSKEERDILTEVCMSVI